MTFDIQGYLDSKNIVYSDSGKNTTAGWINIACCFCGEDSNHLGINLESKLFSCWICGQTGGPEQLVRQIESCSYQKAKQIVSQFQTEDTDYKERKPQKNYTDIILPKEATRELPKKHLDYLTKRNFDHSIIQKYHLHACNIVGKYKFRIIIPIVIDGEIVSFTGRDVTGRSKLRYKHAEIEESIIPVKSCLYNIDTIKDKAIIVEGPTDVWRVGDGCIATMGTKYTPAQINLLLKKQIKEVVIIFDSKADKEAMDLAKELSGQISDVWIHQLYKGDPAELSLEQVNEIRNDFFN